MEVIKNLNVSLRFILEIALLLVLAFSSYQIIDNPIVKWTFTIGLPIVTAITWGFLIAPKSQHMLSSPYRTIVVVILFSIATVLLAKAGKGIYALSFFAIFLINEILLIIWNQ